MVLQTICVMNNITELMLVAVAKQCSPIPRGVAPYFPDYVSLCRCTPILVVGLSVFTGIDNIDAFEYAFISSTGVPLGFIKDTV